MPLEKPLETPPIEVPIRDNEGKILLSYRRASDKSSLLDLPPEIRLLIYNYVFDDAVIEIRWSYPGNDRRDRWFVSDRNLMSHKFISTSCIRPHIWRPRAQILAACRQIRGEIISHNCYYLELNYVAPNYYNTMERCLTPFTWSHITTLSSSTRQEWLGCVRKDLRPPALKSYYTNKAFHVRWSEGISDKFNGVYVIPRKCYEDVKDLEAVKAGAKDKEIFARVKSMQLSFTDPEVNVSALLDRALAEEMNGFCFYVRARIVILPMSFGLPVVSDPREQPSWYWLYPQLVLLVKWDSKTSGEIVERHWRDDAKTGNSWECLSTNKEKCSCLNSAYCSTTMDNEQYCEDWYGNVVGPPAWQEPREIEDEIYPEGYCLFEN